MAQFDPSVPSIARVYDFFLGGKDNFAADRALAEQQISFAPLIPVLARENRQFLARAATWAAHQGITQFVDLGCGMPTTPNTHESARAVIPGAKVAYVDNDPVVLGHLNALVGKGDPGITVVDRDVREPAAILAAIAGGIDLTRPACLIMGYLLHFSAPQAARDLVASYAAALSPGSYVVISVIRADRADADESFGGYSKSVARVFNHSPEDFATFFGPLEMVPPGAVDARQWRPGWEDAISLRKRDGHVMAGVARNPGLSRTGSADSRPEIIDCYSRLAMRSAWRVRLAPEPGHAARSAGALTRGLCRAPRIALLLSQRRPDATRVRAVNDPDRRLNR